MILRALSQREKHFVLKSMACAVATIAKRPADQRHCEQEVRALLFKLAESEMEADVYLKSAVDMIAASGTTRPISPVEDIEPVVVKETAG